MRARDTLIFPQDPQIFTFHGCISMFAAMAAYVSYRMLSDMRMKKKGTNRYQAEYFLGCSITSFVRYCCRPIR
jgi:hypothetical protein